MVRAQDPSVVFLVETWADKARLENLCDELQLDEKWIVQRVTRVGGLALFWKNSIDIDVVSSSLNHIDAIVNKGKEDTWRFIGIYGFPKAGGKHQTWELLQRLNQQFALPWVCAGDFNEILRGHEKQARCQEENLIWLPFEMWLTNVVLSTWAMWVTRLPGEAKGRVD